MNIPVVYEDEWLLVVNKPSGLLVIPTPKKEKRTLTSILDDQAKAKDLPYRFHPCHRLDKETSGLIVYAKGKATQKKMMELFKQRKVNKYYIAFVQGRLSFASGEIGMPLEGRKALTRYKLVTRKKYFDIVDAQPVTGRTNQIRLHFKAIGHPLVGETRFAFRRNFRLKAKRLMLQAKALSFSHPLTNKKLTFNLPLAEDMENFLKQYSQ